MCITGLEKKKASVFFKTTADGYSLCAKEMTKLC
jgi:S-adenosylmethionine decarboxylase